jgi:hypothetical protein
MWVLYILAAIIVLPFLMWLWLGIAFTIAIYIVNSITQEVTMETAEHVTRRDRLIRYLDLQVSPDTNFLSVFDGERNILFIDREQAELLPRQMRNMLECTKLPRTKIVHDMRGLRFEEA